MNENVSQQPNKSHIRQGIVSSFMSIHRIQRQVYAKFRIMKCVFHK